MCVCVCVYKMFSRCLITACTHFAIVCEARDIASVIKKLSNVFCLISIGLEDNEPVTSYKKTNLN